MSFRSFATFGSGVVVRTLGRKEGGERRGRREGREGREGSGRAGVATRAKARQRKGGMGFVEEDNSGKANIFAVEPKTLYTSSPRADREARKGLGGGLGVAVVLGAAAVVAAATVGIGFSGGDGLEAVGSGYEGEETLQEIASRL